MKPLKSFKKINIFAVVLLLLIGIVIGGFLVLKSKMGTASISEQLSQILKESGKTVAICQPNPDDKNKDSDNDGLMDWQETTWQTNPCQADTDGDGYLDGEEVASGYSPVVPAPNDELADYDSIKPRLLPHNLTQALAESLTKRITDQGLETISGALDSTDLITSNRIVDTAIQEAISQSIGEFSLPNIPDEEIIISYDNSIEAIQIYAGKVVEIIEGWEANVLLIREPIAESETQVIYQAIETSDFSQIDKYVAFYQGAAESIKKITVPSDFKDIHKEQIGIFWIMGNIYKAIKQIDQDPLKANLALEQYEATSNLLDQMFLKLANQLDQY
jgi:hypothetical protein